MRYKTTMTVASFSSGRAMEVSPANRMQPGNIGIPNEENEPPVQLNWIEWRPLPTPPSIPLPGQTEWQTGADTAVFRYRVHRAGGKGAVDAFFTLG
ncbi:MAG TPA: hypothetical protein ENH29_03325 [Bacteroidetes bacterium]|nr:hypothetical protein [Bacteroidota bacterium]